ncbi:hypothetical protein ACFFWC_05125 [Plantactinospora siamensis]|uniref:Uncharacterized protein n=1 Tax=Plantactinospora siamensis TaxID=555372 RepID=A0ABV6NSH0_9ACTN
MASDIEQRLTVAARAVREYELAEQRSAELLARIRELSAQVSQLRGQYAEEQADVDRLTGLSLTRVLTALHGSRRDTLARERAEADAARYRLDQAEQLLKTLHDEAYRNRLVLRRLSSERGEHARLLAEKEQQLIGSDDPRQARLLELATERGRLHVEVTKLREGLRAADSACQALSRALQLLDQASGWSSYDTFLGGGIIGSAVKENFLDEAADAAAYAERCLAALRTELSDVAEPALPSVEPAVSGLTRFADIWLDNAITDLAVRSRIQRSTESLDGWLGWASHTREGLSHRLARAEAAAELLDSERRRLLDPP